MTSKNFIYPQLKQPVKNFILCLLLSSQGSCILHRTSEQKNEDQTIYNGVLHVDKQLTCNGSGKVFNNLEQGGFCTRYGTATWTCSIDGVRQHLGVQSGAALGTTAEFLKRVEDHSTKGYDFHQCGEAKGEGLIVIMIKRWQEGGKAKVDQYTAELRTSASGQPTFRDYQGSI